MPEIIFNEELWESGFTHNCRAEGNSLLADESATYISSSIDSLENGTVWSRLTILLKNTEARYKLSFFACDYKTVYTGGELTDINSIIENGSMSAEVKKALLSGLWADAAVNPSDMPLFKAKGRYFWFMLETGSMPDNPPPVIEGLKIEFGRACWTAYLPEIYQTGENSFLNRFLSMPQAIYADLDREISEISRLLDVDCVNPERLTWLSGWVSAEGLSYMPDERLRAFVNNAFSLSEIKGTKECLLRAVELYTGERPLIVEAVNTLPYGYNELYGGDINSFTVIVSDSCTSGGAPSAGGLAAELARLISYYAPIHTRAKIAVLRPFTVLGLHTYLGINTTLSRREALSLNDKTTADCGVVS